MIIDCHVHLLSEKGYAGKLIRQCDRLGVDKVCLLAGPEAFSFWGSRMANNAELQAAHREFPDRIYPFAFFRPGVHVPEEVDRLRERRFVGLKFTWARVNYDEESLYPVYEKAESLRMPILLHTGTILRTPADRAEDVRSTRMRPIFLDTVARHFPGLNLIGAHLGNPWYEEAAMALFWNRNLYFDLSGTTLKRKPASWFKEILWWDDSTKSRLAPNRDLSHYQSALGDTHPLDRICFGTDVPIPEMAAAMDDYKRLANGMDAPESTRRRLWGENILGLLS